MVLLLGSGCEKSKTDNFSEFNITEYIGLWTCIDGSISSTLEIISDEEYVEVMFSQYDSSLELPCVEVSDRIHINNFFESTKTITFKKDNYNGSGSIGMSFERNSIICNVNNLKYPKDAEYGFAEGIYTLVRSEDYFADEVNYYDNNVYNNEQQNVYLNNEIDYNKIKEDLINYGANILKIDAVDEYFDVTNINIEKSSNYINLIEACIIVRLENESYLVDAKYQINYKYYDIGGWILENSEMYEHKTIPINFTPDDERIHSECKKLFTSYEILDHIFTVNEKGDPVHITTFLGVWEAEYVTETHKGIRTYTFTNDRWIESWNFEKYDIDFTRLLGTWKFEHYDEYITINITDVIKENDSYYVTYDYQTSPWCDDGRWGGYITNSSYTTDGSPRIQPSNKLKVSSFDDELEYYTGDYHRGLHSRLKRINKLVIKYFWGNWKNIYDGENAYNYVHIDVDEGLYITGFHYGYKSEEHIKPEAGTYYESWWGSDDMTATIMFEKIK